MLFWFVLHILYYNKYSINMNKYGIIDVGIFLFKLLASFHIFIIKSTSFFEKNKNIKKQKNFKICSNQGGYHVTHKIK